jgi:hypothetical protein
MFLLTVLGKNPYRTRPFTQRIQELKTLEHLSIENMKGGRGQAALNFALLNPAT